jgi:exopolyphosphatase/guanosine-5'-triphosphate,3'-diphosphate pyrophosphatase
MRVAVIDCGTNTFNLLIGDKTENGFQTVFSDKISVKIGKGGIHNALITKDAMERAYLALEAHKGSISKFKADKIRVIATSAFRSASNAHELTSIVKSKLNLDIEIISGDQEAKFIYKGVMQSGALDADYSLIMDVGGGSCEFIIANVEKAAEFFSFDTGVSRLIEMFRPSDPIKPEQIDEMYNYISSVIEPLFTASKKYEILHLVGSSGTFDTFADMIFFETGHQLKQELTLSYDLKDFFEIYDKIIHSTLQQRLQMNGMARFRAEMIVASVIHVKVITDFFKFRNIKSSAYSLKEGVLIDTHA